MKKFVQVQGSIKSNKNILNELNKNIKNIDSILNMVFSKYSLNYLIEVSSNEILI